MKTNCWEFMECGREPGGVNVERDGCCITPTDLTWHGTNGGVNGGRYCWRVAGTVADQGASCIHSRTLSSCAECQFFSMVRIEQAALFRV